MIAGTQRGSLTQNKKNTGHMRVVLVILKLMALIFVQRCSFVAQKLEEVVQVHHDGGGRLTRGVAEGHREAGRQKAEDR